MISIRTATEFFFFALAFPSDPAFGSEPLPTSALIEEKYIRAFPGGTGNVKCIGNYAATLASQVDAAVAGCEHVLWLDGVSHSAVEEFSGMNVWFVFRSGRDAILRTPPASETILAGITRNTVVRLALARELQVSEVRITLDELRAASADGSLIGAFGTGTAAGLVPVSTLKFRSGEQIEIGISGAEGTALALRSALMDLQHGQVADDHAYLHRVAT
jgi:branched-chain amino acid aminotransferase